MKNIHIKTWSSLLLIISIMGSYSCKKSLDDSLGVIPHDRLTDETVWTDEGTADLFLNDIYGQLPDGNNWYDPFDNWSDNSICAFGWPNSRNEAQQANFTPSTLTFGDLGNTFDWRTNYNKIRKTNLFIAKVTASGLSDDYKKKKISGSKIPESIFLSFIMDVLWRSTRYYRALKCFNTGR